MPKKGTQGLATLKTHRKCSPSRHSTPGSSGNPLHLIAQGPWFIPG